MWFAPKAVFLCPNCNSGAAERRSRLCLQHRSGTGYPTGAAIVKTLVSGFDQHVEMSVSGIGYGAGARDFAGHPNVLRLIMGDSLEEQQE